MSGKKREEEWQGVSDDDYRKGSRESGNLGCTGDPDVRSFSGVEGAACENGWEGQRCAQRQEYRQLFRNVAEETVRPRKDFERSEILELVCIVLRMIQREAMTKATDS